MDRFHRYYRLHRVFTSRRLPVSRAVLERELQCSRASVMRIIEELRNCGAPIEYLREADGYRYTPGKASDTSTKPMWRPAREPGAAFPARLGMNRDPCYRRLG